MNEFDTAYHHHVVSKSNKRLIVLMMLDSPTYLYDNDASDTATLRQYLGEIRARWDTGQEGTGQNK